LPYTITKTNALRSRDTLPFKDSANLDPAVVAALDRIGRAVRTHPALRSRSLTVSDDGLTRTTTTVWDSRAAYAEFAIAHDADLTLVRAAADAYQQAQGFVVTTFIQED
jgi:hypothetical protein